MEGINTKKKNRIARDFKKNYSLYLLILPVIAFFAIFSYGPMFGVLMAFQNYNMMDGIFGSQWVGFEHFVVFFKSNYFGRLIRNTVIFSLLDLAIVFPTPIILAIMLNSVLNKFFKRFVQTAVYLPYFISVVVVAGLLRNFLAPAGFIGAAFTKLGLISEGEYVLGEPKFFRGIIVVSNIWQTIGFQSIIFIAALSSIDPTLYEAAEIDGAGRTSKLLRITLPSILPMIMLMLVLKIGTLLAVGYEKIVLLYNSSTWEVGDVIGSYVYRLGFETASVNYSYTTAIGLFNSVVSLILLLVANFLSKKTTGYGMV